MLEALFRLPRPTTSSSKDVHGRLFLCLKFSNPLQLSPPPRQSLLRAVGEHRSLMPLNFSDDARDAHSYRSSSWRKIIFDIVGALAEYQSIAYDLIESDKQHRSIAVWRFNHEHRQHPHHVHHHRSRCPRSQRQQLDHCSNRLLSPFFTAYISHTIR